MPDRDDDASPPDDETIPPDDETAAAEAVEHFDRPVDRFRRGAVGSVVAAGLLGLRDAMEGRPEREEIVIVSEAPSQPHDDNLELKLDPDHPERSVVIVRRPPPTDEAES
jgi:hypothetical protein